jgi:hypothetical protein
MMKSPMQEIVELFDNLAEGGPLPDKDKLLKYRYCITHTLVAYIDDLKSVIIAT